VVAPAIGAVVLVRFPFSDLSQSKLRPAVVLADVGRGDRILWPVTSKPYGDPSSWSSLRSYRARCVSPAMRGQGSSSHMGDSLFRRNTVLPMSREGQ
jgi:hypothetical protein